MKKYIIVAIIVVIGGLGFLWIHSADKSAYDTAVVQRGSITQEVSASGNVAAPTTINLQFQNSGKLTSVSVKVGDKVTRGEVIARQDTSVLNAQLQQAQATLDTQKANLASLVQGTSPEQLSVDQSAVTNAQTTLLDAIQSGYVQVQDGINNKIIPFFGTNSTIQEPITLDSKYYNLLSPMTQALSSWNSEINATTPGDPQKLAQDADNYLTTLISSVDSVSSDMSEQANQTVIPLSTVQSLLAQITAVRVTLTSTKTSIDSALTALTTAEGALTLAQTGSTANDIASQQAQVEQAQAGVAAIQAQIAQMELDAPVSGTVTEVNSDVGETVTPTTTVVSIIPDTTLQADINLSEDNVANVKVGDPVQITLDSFPGTTLEGTVVEIDPAETIISGAIYYQTTVTFNQPDVRIKSGMTANVLIETGTSSNTLIVPASAVQTDSTGTFVQLDQNGKITNQNVTTGLKSQAGMVEVTSGLSEGQLVVTGTK